MQTSIALTLLAAIVALVLLLLAVVFSIVGLTKFKIPEDFQASFELQDTTQRNRRTRLRRTNDKDLKAARSNFIWSLIWLSVGVLFVLLALWGVAYINGTTVPKQNQGNPTTSSPNLPTFNPPTSQPIAIPPMPSQGVTQPNFKFNLSAPEYTQQLNQLQMQQPIPPVMQEFCLKAGEKFTSKTDACYKQMPTPVSQTK